MRGEVVELVDEASLGRLQIAGEEGILECESRGGALVAAADVVSVDDEDGGFASAAEGFEILQVARLRLLRRAAAGELLLVRVVLDAPEIDLLHRRGLGRRASSCRRQDRIRRRTRRSSATALHGLDLGVDRHATTLPVMRGAGSRAQR